jgi:hypothetical protein
MCQEAAPTSRVALPGERRRLNRFKGLSPAPLALRRNAFARASIRYRQPRPRAAFKAARDNFQSCRAPGNHRDAQAQRSCPPRLHSHPSVATAGQVCSLSPTWRHWLLTRPRSSGSASGTNHPFNSLSLLLVPISRCALRTLNRRACTANCQVWSSPGLQNALALSKQRPSSRVRGFRSRASVCKSASERLHSAYASALRPRSRCDRGPVAVQGVVLYAR